MQNLLKISDAASMALHAMIMIGQVKKQPASVKNMAETLDVSANHLSKVLQRLVKANLVTSMKGYGGGFFLLKEPKDITFLEIYEAIDGELEPSNCLLNRKKVCSDCIMGNFLKSVNKKADEYFSRTTLADFSKKDFNK